MEYISVKEASALWKIDASNIGKLCRKGKIDGAKIVGRNWLIPKNAMKPVDGRTRKAKEKQNGITFRFPLYVNFSEESFTPPLSKEETMLRQAQVFFYACEFEKAKTLFEELSESSESIYVKICAYFYMCVLSAEYDIRIDWGKYYFGMIFLLSADFPHKKEMELFLQWLDVYIGQFGRIPEKMDTDYAYEYHSSALYMNAFLSVFNFADKKTELSNIKSSEPFVTLCRLMERDGYYIEAQELHEILFIYHCGLHNEEETKYHLRKVIEIAFEHNFLLFAADLNTYYEEPVSAVLSEYPESFAELIRKYSKITNDNFSRFAAKISNTNVYEKLSRSDYRYVFYAIDGYPNKQVASFCGVSERTVAKRYNDIYAKLGVFSKQEMIAKMNSAFGNER